MKVQERCGAFYRVHFQAVSTCENLLTGSIMQDSLVSYPEWIVLIQMNLLHLIKSMWLSWRSTKQNWRHKRVNWIFFFFFFLFLLKISCININRVWNVFKCVLLMSDMILDSFPVAHEWITWILLFYLVLLSLWGDDQCWQYCHPLAVCFTLFFLCLPFQFQTLRLLTCPIAKSIMRPHSAGGCLRTTYLLITMCLNTAGGCKLKEKWLQDKKGGLCGCHKWLIGMWSKSELFDYDLLFFFFPQGWGPWPVPVPGGWWGQWRLEGYRQGLRAQHCGVWPGT